MLHEYIRPGTESCRHRGLVEARIPGKRPHDAAGCPPEALLHPRHQYPRCAVPQFRHPQILGRTDRRRLDLPAQQFHRQCHFAPVEPAVLLRREDRCPDRRRQPRPGGFPQGASPCQQLGFRRHLEGQEERPAGEAQTQAGQRIVGLYHRQEQKTHQGLLVGKSLPQYGGGRAHHQRHAAPADGERHVPHRPQEQGQDRQDQFHGQRTVQGQTPAPYLQEDPPEEHQHFPRGEAQRKRLRRGQRPPDRLLQLARLP